MVMVTIITITTITILLYCEAHIAVQDIAFVDDTLIVNDVAKNNEEELTNDNHTEKTYPSEPIEEKPVKIVEKKSKEKHKEMVLDLPIDAFTLHHPFIHTSTTQFEYSQWYFLFFTFFDKSSSLTIDVSLTVPEIKHSLSSKLSVPTSVFSISRVEKYRSNSISANISLTNFTIPRLHHRLCNLQNLSPLFWIKGTRYKLVQVIHDKNQHLYLHKNIQVSSISSDELGMLLMLGMVGMGVFLLVAALACLAGKLANKNFQDVEQERIMQEEEDDLENIENEGAIFIIDEGTEFDGPGIPSIAHGQKVEPSKRGVSDLSRCGVSFRRTIQELKHFHLKI